MTGDVHTFGPKRKHSRNNWEARQDCIHHEMQQLLEESHAELGLTEVLQETSALAEFLDCDLLLKQPKLRKYLKGRWNLFCCEVEHVLLGRSELQSWWDELQECERNLKECLSDPGSASIALSGKSSLRTVQSSSGSVDSVQTGSKCSRKLPNKTSSLLECKNSSASGSSGNSQVSSAQTSSAHVSTPPVTAFLARNNIQTNISGTAGATAADPVVVHNSLRHPHAAICSCQRQQVLGFGSALLLPERTATAGSSDLGPQPLARL